MQQLVLIVHLLVALAVIGLVLIQHGKGADVGASFGSGAANTMFGSVGPASFLMKMTSILAAIFFATSIGLGYMMSHQQQTSTFDFLTTNQPSKLDSQPTTLTPPVSEPVGQKSK